MAELDQPQVTSPMADFMRRYRADDNEWWRIATGEMQNLFDEACDLLGGLIDALSDDLRHEVNESPDVVAHIQKCAMALGGPYLGYADQYPARRW